MIIKSGDIDNALLIIYEAVKWLIDTGKPLWKIDELTKEKILKCLKKDNVYVGYINSEPAAAMLLMWYDPFFWENIKPNESGFIYINYR